MTTTAMGDQWPGVAQEYTIQMEMGDGKMYSIPIDMSKWVIPPFQEITIDHPYSSELFDGAQLKPRPLSTAKQDLEIDLDSPLIHYEWYVRGTESAKVTDDLTLMGIILGSGNTQNDQRNKLVAMHELMRRNVKVPAL